MAAAGEAAGRAAAADALPAAPAECYQDVPYASLRVDMEAVTLITLSDVQVDAANASKRRCVRGFYENLRKEREKV